jgi:hypothetical protein
MKKKICVEKKTYNARKLPFSFPTKEREKKLRLK